MMKSSKEQENFNSSLIVRVFWGDILYDTVLCEPKQPVTVGRQQGSTFVLDLGRGSLVSRLPLLTCLPNESAELCFDSRTEGHVRAGGKLLPLEKLRALADTEKTSTGLYKFKLANGDTASIVIGYVSFEIAWSKGRNHVPRPIVLDSRAPVFISAISVSMLLLLTLFTVPKIEEEEKPPERIVEIVSRRIVQPKAAVSEDSAPPASGAPQPAAQVTRTPPPQPKAPTAAEALKNADLGSLVKDLSSIGTNVAAPNVKREVTADNGPVQSFSASAVTATSTSKATLGKTQGAGEGGFTGAGPGLAGNNTLVGGNGTVLGAPGGDSAVGLDRQVIDQIVRRRQDRIRLCYERQLSFVPGLAGKVTVQFLIDGNGSVMKTSMVEDTMKNDTVNNCIATEVKAWTFPKPKGGVTVKVDYPFVFESGAR